MTPPRTSPTMTGQRSRPMVSTKVAEIVTVTRNSAAFVEPIANRAVVPFPTSVEATSGPPSASAYGIEKAAAQPKRRHLCGGYLGVEGRASQCLPQDHPAHDSQIETDQGPHNIHWSGRQHIGSEAAT